MRVALIFMAIGWSSLTAFAGPYQCLPEGERCSFDFECCEGSCFAAFCQWDPAPRHNSFNGLQDAEAAPTPWLAESPQGCQVDSSLRSL